MSEWGLDRTPKKSPPGPLKLRPRIQLDHAAPIKHRQKLQPIIHKYYVPAEDEGGEIIRGGGGRNFEAAALYNAIFGMVAPPTAARPC